MLGLSRRNNEDSIPNYRSWDVPARFYTPRHADYTVHLAIISRRLHTGLSNARLTSQFQLRRITSRHLEGSSNTLFPNQHILTRGHGPSATWDNEYQYLRL